MLIELIAFFVIVGLLLYLYNQNSRHPNLPPGLFRFPVIGSIPFLRLPAHECYKDLSTKYGSIFSLYIFNFPAVVISDPQLVREAFKLEALSGRPDSRVFTERSWGKKRGILFNEGVDWQDQRRFALKHLRDLGFGKGTMENIIMHEVTDFVQYLKKSVDKPMNLKRIFNIPVVNGLWNLVASERFDYDDDRLKTLIRELLDNFANAENLEAIFFMPWFTKLAPKLSGWTDFFAVLGPTLAFLDKPIQEHKKTFNPDNVRDLIDVYLEQINKTTDSNSEFYKDNGEKSLTIIMLDLFAAGAETVSTTLNFSVLYLLNYPEVQHKLHKEIDTIIGQGRAPSLSDRPKMHYLEAFIAETLRHASFTPLGVFHGALESVNFHGHTIPKGTMIFPNFWQIHHDEKIWGDPANFRVDRFIDDTGHYKKNDNLMAFSVGKRVCLGESLARDEVFLFLAGLLQSYTFEPEVKGSPPSMEVKSPGFLRVPEPYQCIIRSRAQ